MCLQLFRLLVSLLLLLPLASAFRSDRSFEKNSSDIIRAKCSSRTSCLKLDLLRMINRVGNSTRIPLGPGIALVGTERTAQIAFKLYPLALSSEPLEPFLRDLIAEYLGSLNLTLQVRESNLLQQFKQLGQQLWAVTAQNSSFVGRAKHKSGWYAIGTVAAVGFALLAALCGKALMASMLALALSALVALRAGGPGFGAAASFASPSGRVTQYEIISKPAVAYATAPAHYYDHEHHHHSSVAHTAPTYTYGKRDLDGSKEE